MARVVSVRAIEQAAAYMNGLSEGQIQGLIDLARAEQPALLEYLLCEETSFNDEERELVLWAGMTLLQALRSSQPPIRRVTEKQLLSAYEAAEEDLQALDPDDDEALYDYTDEVLEDYPEPNLLNYLIETVMEDADLADDEDETPTHALEVADQEAEEARAEIRDEYVAVVFFHLKAALDALIATRQPKGA